MEGTALMTIDTPAPPGARNATLVDLAALLRGQQDRKVDIVAPAAAIRASGARLVVDESAPVIGPDGVTMTHGTYAPTNICDQGVADKLGIPATYLRRMRELRPALPNLVLDDVGHGTSWQGQSRSLAPLETDQRPSPGRLRSAEHIRKHVA